MVVIDREEKTLYIVNFANPMDHHVREKVEEKIDKYMDWATEVRRQFRVEASDCINWFRSSGYSPSKTIRITRKIGNRRRN